MLEDLDFVADEGVTCPLDEDEIYGICELVLAEEGVSRPCFVSVTIVGEEHIHEINHTWRGVDRATDVVSLECERPDDPDLAEGEPCELGDVILAPAYIERQAQRFGTTFPNEFRLLLIHGLLHLLGYDHIEEEDAVVMERREDQLVALACGSGTLGHVTTTRHDEDDAR